MPPAPEVCCTIPLGTPVRLEIMEPLSSKTQKEGDQFKIRLAQPVSVHGQVVLTAGDVGVGEVVDVAPAGFTGRGGKLVLAARYIDQQGVRVRLMAFKLGGSGVSHEDSSLVVSTVGAVAVGPLGVIPGVLIKGGQIDIPAGAEATAKLSSAIDLHPAASPDATDRKTSP